MVLPVGGAASGKTIQMQPSQILHDQYNALNLECQYFLCNKYELSQINLLSQEFSRYHYIYGICQNTRIQPKQGESEARKGVVSPRTEGKAYQGMHRY
jgi:hypothetical protein